MNKIEALEMAFRLGMHMSGQSVFNQRAKIFMAARGFRFRKGKAGDVSVPAIQVERNLVMFVGVL